LPDTPGVLSCEAYKRGAVAIGCEYLGAGQLSTEGVAAYRSGIARCLASWQIIDAPTRVESPTSIFEGDWQLAEHDGIVRNFIRIKQQVKAGDLLCRIDDLRGEPVQEVRAQDAGIVGGVRSKAYIRKGNWAVMVLRQIS
jgi:predicted deacylase